MRKFVVLSFLFIVGCASGPVGKLPGIQADKNVGEVFVMRNRNIVGAAISYYITVDGTTVFAIRVGKYTKFTLPVGHHHIGVQCFGGWFPTWKEDSKPFTLHPGEQLFFIVSPSGSCADIKSMDASLGKETISSYKYIEMEE